MRAPLQKIPRSRQLMTSSAEIPETYGGCVGYDNDLHIDL